eukprot:PhF_6_TR37617/c0_g1_i1/m.55906
MWAILFMSFVASCIAECLPAGPTLQFSLRPTGNSVFPLKNAVLTGSSVVTVDGLRLRLLSNIGDTLAPCERVGFDQTYTIPAKFTCIVATTTAQCSGTATVDEYHTLLRSVAVYTCGIPEVTRHREFEWELLVNGFEFFQHRGVGQFYKVYTTPTLYAAASTACGANTRLLSMTPYLATISGDEDNDFVASIIPKDTRGVWLCGADWKRNSQEWRWQCGPDQNVVFYNEATGVVITYANWDGSCPEPACTTGCTKYYLTMRSNRLWYDSSSSPGDERSYVCEWSKTASVSHCASLALKFQFQTRTASDSRFMKTASNTATKSRSVSWSGSQPRLWSNSMSPSQADVSRTNGMFSFTPLQHSITEQTPTNWDGTFTPTVSGKLYTLSPSKTSTRDHVRTNTDTDSHSPTFTVHKSIVEYSLDPSSTPSQTLSRQKTADRSIDLQSMSLSQTASLTFAHITPTGGTKSNLKSKSTTITRRRTLREGSMTSTKTRRTESRWNHTISSSLTHSQPKISLSATAHSFSPQRTPSITLSRTKGSITNDGEQSQQPTIISQSITDSLSESNRENSISRHSFTHSVTHMHSKTQTGTLFPPKVPYVDQRIRILGIITTAFSLVSLAHTHFVFFHQ